MQFLEILDMLGITPIQLIIFIVSTIFSLILFSKTGDIKYIKGVLDDMHYQKGNYFLTEDVNKKTGEIIKVKNPSLKYSQSFNSKVPIYRLNKATNELEKTDEFVDVQELINSYKDTALQSMFDRFMPKIVDETADYTNVKGDLDMMTETFEVAEEYRDKFGLPDDMSIQDIFKHIETYSKQLKEKLQSGGIKDEKKENVEESK